MSNQASGFWRDGRAYPTAAQFTEAMDAYDALTPLLGDDPNAIADRLEWTRGTGAVIRRMSIERRAGL